MGIKYICDACDEKIDRYGFVSDTKFGYPLPESRNIPFLVYPVICNN